MSPSPPRAAVVSLHDVSPRTWTVCARILEELRDLGASRVSLLVIPDHHHTGRVGESTACVEGLRKHEQAGCEIITHGYYHQRETRPGESAADRFFTRLYTAGEAEFYDLNRSEARELAARGQAELRALGLQARGFIAPGWLLGREAESGVRDAGAEYTVRLRTVHNLRSGQAWRTQSLVWSVRSAWRQIVSLFWNAGLWRALQQQPLLRISIHPVDAAHPAIWGQIRNLVRRSLVERPAVTYGAWISSASAS